ncbi:hypothetical protein INR49_008775 [Caranx melampygus]|nr:hypothetical protein INR49_008775 [Caranx melampygus]
MAELRWIQTCLSLILGLQVTAVTGQSFSNSSFSSITARAGDDVTLSCAEVIDGEHECDNTDWYFGGSTDTPLVARGRIVVEDKSTSDRLRVTETCALVLKKVSAEDAGRFECQQFSSGKLHHTTHVLLSVVSMTERDDGDEVTLTCSVSAHSFITHTVKWLYEGGAVGGGNTDMKTSEPLHSATVTFPSTDLRKTKNQQSFQCQVSDNTGQQFTFTALTSGEEPGDDTTTRTNTGKPGTDPTAPPVSSISPPTSALLRLVFVSVGLMALIVTVVTVNMWTRTKGNKRQTNGKVNSDEDEDDGAVNYENVNQSS